MAAGQFVDGYRGGAEDDSDRVFRYQPRYLNAGSRTHHAVQAGELNLIYQDSLFEAAGRSLRGAWFLKERHFDTKP